jgi:outer membrane protein assembly factor BamB
MALVAAMVLGGASTIPWRAASADNVTQAGDSLRTAWDQNEPALTPANVGASDFGQQFSTTVTGSVYAQPLVIGNTVIVTTEAAMAYSINGATGAINWSRSFGPASTSIGCGDLTPNLGSTSTPVYDPATGTVYMTTKLDDGPDTNHPHWYLQAIGIADGTEKAGFPVTIQGPDVDVRSLYPESAARTAAG